MASTRQSRDAFARCSFWLSPRAAGQPGDRVQATMMLYRIEYLVCRRLPFFPSRICRPFGTPDFVGKVGQGPPFPLSPVKANRCPKACWNRCGVDQIKFPTCCKKVLTALARPSDNDDGLYSGEISTSTIAVNNSQRSGRIGCKFLAGVARRRLDLQDSCSLRLSIVLATTNICGSKIRRE